MGAEGATVVTPAAAPATPPAAAPAEGATPSRAERKAAFLKEISGAAGDDAAPAEKTAEGATGEGESKAAKFAEVAREHKRVVEREAKVKAREAELEQKLKDAEIVDALRKKDFSKLKEVMGENWYDEATVHTIGTKNPKAPEVIESKLTDELKQLRAEIEELKKPKEPTEEEKQAEKAQLQERKATYANSLADVALADERFTALKAEPKEDVATELYDYLDRDMVRRQQLKTVELVKQGVDQETAWKRALKEVPPPTRDDVLAAAVKLEAAARAQNELTGKSSSVTNDAGNARKRVHQPQQARGESDSGESETTLTASLHQSVPVQGRPVTKDQRREAARAMIRAAREADDE